MVENDETITHMDMSQLLHDMYDHRGDGPNSGENMNEGIPGPNKEAQSFYDLLKDAEEELWPGCKLTKLSLLVLLFHVNSTSKWTNKSFSNLLQILQLAIPTNLPNSFKEAKKVIDKLGLGYVRIHACPNHCQLFWGRTRLMMIHALFVVLLGGKGRSKQIRREKRRKMGPLQKYYAIFR